MSRVIYGDGHLALRGDRWGDVRLSQSLVAHNSFFALPEG